MKRRPEGVPAVYLKPAEFHMTDRPAVVTTVLGSCVSVTMFHPKLKVGAICHGLLPQCGKEDRCDGECAEPFKYMDCALKHMIERFDRLGIRRREIETKVFGGSEMVKRRGGPEAVGRQNVATALEMIRDGGLRLVTLDTGGLEGRKILFFTHTGDVLLKRLKKGGDGEV